MIATTAVFLRAGVQLCADALLGMWDLNSRLPDYAAASYLGFCEAFRFFGSLVWGWCCFEAGSHQAVLAGLELVIFLTPPSTPGNVSSLTLPCASTTMSYLTTKPRAAGPKDHGLKILSPGSKRNFLYSEFMSI